MLLGKALLNENVGATPFQMRRGQEGTVFYQLALNGNEDFRPLSRPWARPGLVRMTSTRAAPRRKWNGRARAFRCLRTKPVSNGRYGDALLSDAARLSAGDERARLCRGRTFAEARTRHLGRGRCDRALFQRPEVDGASCRAPGFITPTRNSVTTSVSRKCL